jgi:hypothetical protein
MKFRKLRIAWSVGCGILCLLLVVLWVRSYWWMDVIGLRLVGARAIAAVSQPGTMELSVAYPSNSAPPPPVVGSSRFMLSSMPQESPLHMLWAIGRRVTPTGTTAYVYVPHWFAAFLVAIFAAFPWLPWRFTLRTLLIGMTVLAVVLGVAVWSMS